MCLSFFYVHMVWLACAFMAASIRPCLGQGLSDPYWMIDDLDARLPDNLGSAALQINEAGAIVGNVTTIDGVAGGFYWNPTNGIHIFDPLGPSERVFMYSLNDVGEVILINFDSTETIATPLIWSHERGVLRAHAARRPRPPRTSMTTAK